MITFTREIPVSASMIFDACYEQTLQLDLEEKGELLESAIKSFLLVDGKLAGETFGVPLWTLDEEIDDCQAEAKNSVYCYSTTILPEFRGHGYAYLLKAFWLGQVFEMNHMLTLKESQKGPPIVGHSTSPEMKRINERFGAVHDPTPHKKWYYTEREAWFYRLKYE